MKYYIETFGCQMNESDSLLIGIMLEQAGYEKAESISLADIIIVNTCCVRESAENKIRGFIGNLKHNKRNNSNCIIAVCGCMPQKPGAAQLMMNKAGHIDILIGTFALAKLPQYINEVKAGSGPIIDIDECYDGRDMSFSQFAGAKLNISFKAQVSIIYGCNNFCSYCIVPYVRGRERSRSPKLIIEEIKALANKGCKEIQLLGQNVNSYGKDLDNNWDFSRLLEKVSAIEGLERIRYMTSHPRDFNSKLLDTIANNSKICKHFHLPLQSGCDKILKKMNRGYTTQSYLNMLAKIREKCPDAAITSDIIVGFPGETEEDFSNTLDFIKEARFDAAYTFLYSKRSGTPAAEMDNQVDEAEKRRRLKALSEVQNRISLELNQKLIGKTLKVLAEGESKNNSRYFSGRIEQNKIVVFPKKNTLPGEIIKVKITEAKTWNLSGEIDE